MRCTRAANAASTSSAFASSSAVMRLAYSSCDPAITSSCVSACAKRLTFSAIATHQYRKRPREAADAMACEMRRAGDMAAYRKDESPHGSALASSRLQLLQQRLIEGRDIVRLAAGDQLTVDHHLLIAPLRAGVAQVDLQTGPAGHALALGHAGVDQRPRAVADRRDRLVLAREVADEAYRFLTQSQLVRIGHAARQHQRIVITRRGVADAQLHRKFVRRRGVIKALYLLALGLRRDQRHARAVLLQEAARSRVLDLLDAVGHQYRDAFTLQFRIGCHVKVLHQPLIKPAQAAGPERPSVPPIHNAACARTNIAPQSPSARGAVSTPCASQCCK